MQLPTPVLLPRPALAALLVLFLPPLVRSHDEHPLKNVDGAYTSAKPGILPPAPLSYPEGTDKSAALDEAMGGRTLIGTPVRKRGVDEFPAEYRDVFWQMDMVASGPGGSLEPLNFDKDGDGKVGTEGEIGRAEIDAVRGRNTWLLWGGGNEAFWGWLGERGYGLVDFLILMDGRGRESRFKRTGLINQPGFAVNEDREPSLLGLFLDKPVERTIKLTEPVIDPKTGRPKIDEHGKVESRSISTYADESADRKPLFEPGNDKDAVEMLDAVKKWFAKADDGLNTDVYGYPSGIFGLRLMLNPDFFGATKAASQVRGYWKRRVMDPAHANYYNDPKTHADPKLIRPFRVSMSCGFCHVGPHPMNPPANPEAPEWENLSSIIGSQYWRPQPAFGNLLNQNSFLYHFLASQPPGTIDTSLVSTDHISNTNTINAVFEVPARFVRAHGNTVEEQSDANLLIPSIEDVRTDHWRHFPRVLIDGSDSCGGFAAFIRVPLNIGTYSEEWANCHNPIIGFRSQTPFRVAASQSNSVFWQVNEKYRVPYLANFFTYESKERQYQPQKTEGVKLPAQVSTRAMKLLHAGPRELESDGGGKTLGQAELEKNDSQTRLAGRNVFLRHCAICHSSKQPKDFEIAFTRDAPGGGWEKAQAPKPGVHGVHGPPHYTLPMDFAFWGRFKESASYQDYVQRIVDLASVGLTGPQKTLGFALEESDPFIKDNFLSSEIRIPVTLVGTNASRATATNAMRGHVWDNFSSETYKSLPAVGEVHYYNPFLNKAADQFGNNASYRPRGGGPGYYRPATLASLWSTAPFIHNNTIGGFYPRRQGDTTINPTSVRGRLDAFDDAIRRVLWKKHRATPGLNGEVSFERLPGDLRQTDHWATKDASGNMDPGYIYRLPQETRIVFEATFVRQLIRGVTGPLVLSVLQWWLWVALLALWTFAFYKAGTRHVGILFVGLGVLVAGICLLTGVGRLTGTVMGALLGAASGMLSMPAWALWGFSATLAGLGVAFLSGARLRWIGALAIAVLVAGMATLLALGVARIVGVALPGVPGALNRIPVWFLWTLYGITTALAVVVYLIRHHKEWPTKTVFALLAAGAVAGGVATNGFLRGGFGGVSVGPIPKGVPVSLLMNIDPEKGPELARGLVAMVKATVHIEKHGLKDEAAYRWFADHAGAALLDATTCPDLVLDRGHWFGEFLTDEEKEQLIAFLKTL